MMPETGPESPPPGTVWAVVLAGGAARRFGSDKLAARLDGRRLLDHAVTGLPPRARLVIVGPDRGAPEGDPAAEGRPIEVVREDPPGGGPAAAMVRGLLAVLAARPAADDAVLVLPGDTPGAGRAASLLLAALEADPSATALVGVDAGDREQPLQLALRPSAARRLVAEAGPDGARDASARRLVRSLGDDLGRLALPADGYADVDTPADLARLAARSDPRDDLRNVDRA